MKFLILNGPNLNLLGEREPNHYGSTTYQTLCEHLVQFGLEFKLAIECKQSNHEGTLVDYIQQGRTLGCSPVNGIIINPGAYTHTSIAIRDALIASNLPTVEVHISQVAKREGFRQHSYMSDVVLGTISGFGVYGYDLAILALKDHLSKNISSS